LPEAPEQRLKRGVEPLLSLTDRSMITASMKTCGALDPIVDQSRSVA